MFIYDEETDLETTNNQLICCSCKDERGYDVCTKIGKVIADSTFSCGHICNDCFIRK